MNRAEALRMANGLTVQHGLPDTTVELDRAKKRRGQYRYRDNTISISRHFIDLNDAERVRETILHEIAHGLNYREHGPRLGRGHGWRWKRIARQLGVPATRCGKDAKMPEGHWTGTCSDCQVSYARFKKPSQLTTYYHPRCRRAGMPNKGLVSWVRTSEIVAQQRQLEAAERSNQDGNETETD